MNLKIDYHFHPNLSGLSKKLAYKKAQKIRKKFQEKDINCVIVTEHSFKNPSKAYQIMKETKPNNFYCFPWIECISKEWVDVITFSLREDIFSFKEFKPYKLDYFELINFINSTPDVFGFIPHPYSLNLSWVVSKLGNIQYKTSLDLINAVEISNWSYDNLYSLFRKAPFKLVFNKKIKKIHNTLDIPTKDYTNQRDFVAVGSDAHHIQDIWNCCKTYHQKETTPEKIFETITNNINNFEIQYNDFEKTNFKLLIRSWITSFHEFLIKKYYKLLSIVWRI